MHGGNARAGGGPSTRRDRVAAAKLNRLRRGFRQSRPGFRHDVARARSLAGGNFWHLVADLFVRDRRKLWPVRLIRCAL
jgi:hypothetical protein